MLARRREFRSLSSVQLQSTEDEDAVARVNAVLSYISEHINEPLAMADVCARFRMPESRFSRFFRRATGNTFTDFVNRMRITKACQLLMETDRYVTTICYEVGFNNVANFNRRFLELKGMTPTDFRRQAASRVRRGGCATLTRRAMLNAEAGLKTRPLRLIGGQVFRPDVRIRRPPRREAAEGLCLTSELAPALATQTAPGIVHRRSCVVPLQGPELPLAESHSPARSGSSASNDWLAR